MLTSSYIKTQRRGVWLAEEETVYCSRLPLMLVAQILRGSLLAIRELEWQVIKLVPTTELWVQKKKRGGGRSRGTVPAKQRALCWKFILLRPHLIRPNITMCCTRKMHLHTYLACFILLTILSHRGRAHPDHPSQKTYYPVHLYWGQYRIAPTNLEALRSTMTLIKICRQMPMFPVGY